jgi:4-amino-4-deoxy-L-arabinose transferase-like glycosyltransferase
MSDPMGDDDGGWTGRNLRSRTLRFVFADRVGAALFFGTLAFVGLYWRIDIFITDTAPVANAVANLADGRFSVIDVPYGAPTDPGMHVVDGLLYARNYAQVVLATPLVWLLDGVGAIGSVTLFITSAWSLSVLAVARQVSQLLGRREWTVVGAVLALALFGANALTATTMPSLAHPLLALQFLSMLATGVLVVLLYRILGDLYDRQVGVAGGATALLVTPIGFWAFVPKRHLILAAATAGVVYALLKAHRDGPERRYRAVAYAVVGVSTWVSAPDALAMFAALVPVDLATGSRDRRSIATVAGAFAVSLLPFLVTNALISGNPALPPRMLTTYDGTQPVIDAVEGVNGPTVGEGGVDGSGAGGEGGGGGLSVLSTVIATGVQAGGVFVRLLTRGVESLDPERLFYVVVRSGRIPGVDYSQTGGETIELTILESAPVLGALVAAPLVGRLGKDRLRASTVPADAFAVLSVATFGFMYLPRLPLHATITVRYLIPLVPVGVYGVYRLRPVREALSAPRLTVLAGGTVVIAGGAFAMVAFAGVGDAIGVPMQAHAVANLVVAGVVAAWGVLAVRRDVDPRVGAVVLGVAVGASTLLVLVSGLEYFGGGRMFVLPIAEVIESLIPVR